MKNSDIKNLFSKLCLRWKNQKLLLSREWQWPLRFTTHDLQTQAGVYLHVNVSKDKRTRKIFLNQVHSDQLYSLIQYVKCCRHRDVGTRPNLSLFHTNTHTHEFLSLTGIQSITRDPHESKNPSEMVGMKGQAAVESQTQQGGPGGVARSSMDGCLRRGRFWAREAGPQVA